VVQGESTKRGKQEGKGKLVFYTKTEDFTLSTSAEMADWLHSLFNKFSIQNAELISLEQLKISYEKRFSSPFESFLISNEWKTLREKGLLLV
jgi:hypothetical protein